MRFPQTIDLAPYVSRIHHQLRSRKTRGPDVTASVSRLIFMRRHDNAQSDTPQSNTECRTDITIRARTVYIHQMSHYCLCIASDACCNPYIKKEDEIEEHDNKNYKIMTIRVK